jgi:D-lactate dehydrogenase
LSGLIRHSPEDAGARLQGYNISTKIFLRYNGGVRLVYFYNEEWEKEYISARLAGVEISFFAGTVNDHPDVRDDKAEALSVFVSSSVGPAELDRFPKLKLIATRSTGFDHINLAEAQKRGITVVSVPSYGENTVAEQAFALLLCLSRRIYDSYKQVEQSGSFSTEGLRGFDLKGKTIGVVGTGHIGKHMVRIAKGFEMKVIAYDKFPDEKLMQELGFHYVTLDELLAQSDIISLHAPHLPETHHMIGMENIKKIKRGAYLINTARGGLVDTAAVVLALSEGILSGAGLDTLEEEGTMVNEMKMITDAHPNEATLKTVLENHYLINHPRVIITPHNAFNTQEALERILGTTIDNIKAFVDGSPANVVANK